jgi:hypothetical protein
LPFTIVSVVRFRLHYLIFLGAFMAEFGKRRVAGDARAYSRSTAVAAAPTADVVGALAAIQTGKMPYWANTGPLRIVFILLLVAVTFWFLVLPYAGDVVRDHRLAGTWQPAYDMQVLDGKCTRHNFILTTCEAKIKSLADPNAAPLPHSFMMLFTSGGGEPLLPVRSTVDPSALSIAYAAETELLNRTLTFIFMSAFSVLLFIGGVNELLRGRYAGGAAHHALLAGFEELKARVESARQGEPRATA